MYWLVSTRGTVLDKEQLKKYLANFAADNVIKENSNLDTYPVPRMIDNFKYISLVYTLLNEHIKLKIPIHPAGEWLLDNYYLIENTVETVSNSLSKKNYKKLPRIANGAYSGFARIFVFANEIITNTDGRITGEDLKEYIEAYQTQKNLTMEEIWNLGIFLNIAIIEKIRGITEKVFSSQMQKYKVENILARILENKNNKKLKLDVDLYPFIEYMAYRLKTCGMKTDKYLEILEEQVKKGGLTLAEVIKKEHFDIALKKLSMQNCITSIKTISRIDLQEIFESVNVVEQILKQDKFYPKMDYQTKGLYRDGIRKIAKRFKASEVYIAQEAFNMTENKEGKKAHIGYYIISDGKYELISKLKGKKIKPISNETKSFLYIFAIYFLTAIFTVLIGFKSVLLAIFSFVPIQNLVTKVIQFILNKSVKPKILPKMDFEEAGIPEEYATMCVITSLIKDSEEVEELMKKLEIYYLANKTPNIYFTLLGDCTSEKVQTKDEDKNIANTGKQLAAELNEKYGAVFNFIYRKREWSSNERCYMGWERKRGILTQLNEFLVTGRDMFWVNTCNNLPKIKYVITLDSDTKLELNTATKLVGTMAHILNEPEINRITNTVEAGHALIQPRIGIGILAERKTTFTRIFAGSGGIDLYTNAISDVYQDNFDEGIYTGKGIYDVKIFHELLKNAIPENTVLSHDLLEGSYLRCGLATDIVLIDNYPSNYISFALRKERWIRGDVQVVGWLNSTLNRLSKYKILDNLARDSENIWILILLILSLANCKALAIAGVVILLPLLLDLFYSKNEEKLICKKDSNLMLNIKRCLVNLSIIPNMAFVELKAFCKSIYRMTVSHNFLLEWTTAEEAERKAKKDLKNYYSFMVANVIFGIAFLFSKNIVLILLAILWLVSPYLQWKMSKDIKEEINISKEEENYLLEKAKLTWNFFEENTVNGLPSDNYQEDRRNKKASITSPTNIGLYLLSAISAYDLKIKSYEETLQLINKTITTIESLPKWNGHLYNWYDINTLEVAGSMYVSSVDSGNLAGYLYTLKQFLIDEKADTDLIKRVSKLIDNMDFSVLYDAKVGLFSIGYDVENNKLTESYYDLLATEARQTSLIAIAKRDVTSKHWSNLSRMFTKMGKYKGLVSWGGTAFEYLMPSINIPSYQTTILDESNRFLILSQRKYAQKLGIPWGISEAAYNTKDLKGNYQYKTFGVPWLGLKRGLEEDIVVSPYSSAMSMKFYPHKSIRNLKEIESGGGTGKYGFFESIDYKPQKNVVKTFMAHHQGLILASIDNVLNKNIMQKRFMENPEIAGIDILLQEKMPETSVITKKKRKKVEKIKYTDYEEAAVRNTGINVLSNEKYTIITKSDGSGSSRFETEDISDKICFYIKDINSKKVYVTPNKTAKYSFTPSETEINIKDGNVIITAKIVIVPNLPIEIRELRIKNIGNTEITLEVTSYMEVLLCKMKEFYYHPAFNKMFIEYEKIENGILFTRRIREKKKKIFVATSLVRNKWRFRI